MLTEEQQQAKDAYEAKLENNKLLRAELDADVLVNPIRFHDDIHETIKTIGDIFYYCVLQRKGTLFSNTGELQTSEGRRRTIEDTYRLQRSYNIRCQFKDVKDIFNLLYDNGYITWVFCKRTLVRTYSNANLGTTIKEINDFLEENNLNFKIREVKKKLKLKKYGK